MQEITLLNLIGSIICLIGVLMIFDGRRVVRKYLNFGEENLAVRGIKILGFIFAAIGAWMII